MSNLPTRSYNLHTCSVKYSYRVLKDIFVILEMHVNANIFILLRTPLLETLIAMIDIYLCELVSRFQDHWVVFNIFKIMCHKNKDAHCFKIDTLQELVDEVT